CNRSHAETRRRPERRSTLLEFSRLRVRLFFLLSRDLETMLKSAFLLLATLSASATSQTTHPLDPLSGPEIRRATDLLQRSGRLTDKARFGTIVVQPRSKTAPEPRAARVVGF